jgi:dTDP-4-dehydrorhamnose reductase
MFDKTSDATSQPEPEWTRPDTPPLPPIAVWGGIECTVNRVRQHYFDQVERCGHARRLDDLDYLAGLGIAALRYPALWEKSDWAWMDERLGRLRELGVRPIVGLVHHGSGPRHTSLLDGSFAEGLAEYAEAVARRYPWVEDFTPVNEPLTTARFSCLYGLWYPHAQDTRSFVRALLVQCRAITMAMRAIRGVTPAARLVQTEDFGRTFGTPALQEQVTYENHRRYLSLDLICGRVTPKHALWAHLREAGASEAELQFFIEHPCPPDVVGVNYYLTSDRFLDHRLERYPRWTHGGNGRQSYADVEAVRVRRAGIAGHRAVLEHAWDRYRLPLAITEVHAGATREEQLRWVRDAWRDANACRAAGVDVRAMTIWSLLGSSDWDKAVMRATDHYEPGAFDVRGCSPRRTAIGRLTQQLARGGTCEDHPALGDLPGWWRRPERLLYPPDGLEPTTASHPPASRRQGEPQPILLTGGGGTLGHAFGRLCAQRGLPHRVLCRADLDITDPAAVDRALEAFRPWAVVNCAGFVRVDDAERSPERCYEDNVVGPTVLARACARAGVGFVTFSSDLVFDGEKTTPYVESDVVGPLNVYGATKAAAERAVLAEHPGALVVRSSAFFGPWDAANFVAAALRTFRAGAPFVAAASVVVSPTYVPDLVEHTLDLLIDGESGIWHLANRGAVDWAAFARQTATLAGFDPDLVRPVDASAVGWTAARPQFSALGSERAELLPRLEESLRRCLAHMVEAEAARDQCAHA